MPKLQPAPYSKDYEITDAMFGAFRSLGGARFFWVLLGWATLLLSALGLLTYGPLLSAYLDMMRALVVLESEPQAIAQIWSDLTSFFLLLTLYLIGYIAILGVIRAAFFRGYFKGEARSYFPLAFGREEVSQILAVVGFTCVMIALCIIPVLVILVPLSIFTIGFNDSPDGLGLFLLGFLLTYVAIFVLMIWGGIRLYPAGALTALRGQTHLMAARHVSKNRFWALFGSLLVAGLVGYVVVNSAFMSGLLLAFSGLQAGDILTILSGTDLEASVEAMNRAAGAASFKLTSFIAIIVVNAGYAFYILILAGPQAFFTKQWAEAGGIVEEG